jgi:hypothetical protein
VGTLILESSTALSVTNVNELALAANTTVVSLAGSNAINIKHFSSHSSALVTAANLSGALTFSGGSILTAISGTNTGDTINLKSSASTIYGMGGNDTIVIDGDMSGNTVYLGDGDDTFRHSGAGTNTITGGDGADAFQMDLDSVQELTISDFAVGTDRLVLYGSAETINVASQSGATGAYAIAPLTQGGSVTLTGVTATDFSESIQLGRDLNNPLTHLKAQATALVASSTYHDYISVNRSAGSTLTLGSGADTVEVVLLNSVSAGSADRVTITDFVVGEDLLVLTGSSEASTSIDAYSGRISAGGALKLGGASSEIVLKYAGTGITTSGLSTSLQFGFSSGTTDGFTIQSATNVTLGTLNDFIIMPSVGSTSIVTIKDNGGIDFITTKSAFEVNYNLSGISNDLTTAVAAGATKIANALSGSTYIFADGESGTASAKIEYVGSAAVSVGQAQLTAVATFLNAGLGGTTGEQYLAVINDLSGNAAYTYKALDANADGVFTGDEITLLTVFDVTDRSADAPVVKADLTQG